MLLRVPPIVETVAPPETRWRLPLANDARGDTSGLTDVTSGEEVADAREDDRLPIGVLRDLRPPVRVVGDDPERNSARPIAIKYTRGISRPEAESVGIYSSNSHVAE